MKKLFNAFLALAAGLAIAGCAKEYDDSALQDKVNNLDKKVTELEKKVNSLTEEVTGLATTVKQWKEGGFVESVTEIKEGDVVVGYTVKFVGGQTVVLYNGKNGKDGEPGKNGEPGAPGAAGEAGATPTIILYEGNLVWAIGTEPILVDGKPVPANVVPTFAINDEGHLIMTLQGQETDLGKVKGEDGAAGAGGDSILKSIEVSEDGENVVFTLTNDTTYEIPLAKAFKLVIENTQIEAAAGKTVEIPFKVENGTAEMVDFFVNNSAYEAKIADSKLVVTVPDPFQAAQILVWAQNDKGLFFMVKISFLAKADVVVVTTEESYQAIARDAKEFVIDLTSNVDLDAKVPEAATWVKAVVTKADYKLTLTLEENTTGEPREAEIEIVRADNGATVKTIKIVQLGGEPEPDPVAYYMFDGAAGKHGIPTEQGNSYVPAVWTAPSQLEGADASYPAEAGWKMTLGNLQDNGKGDMWFGANSGKKANLTFGFSEYPEAAAIAKALNVTTEATYYGAMICTTNFPYISKIVITSASDMGGGQATTMWVLKSEDNGVTYSIVEKIDSPAKAGGTVFTIKIPAADRSESASYALAVYRTGGQFQYKAPQITFYSADTTPGYSNPGEAPKELTIERLWGKYPTEWPTFTTNLDRCATTDGEYVYVAKAGGSAKGVWAINIEDPTKVKEVCMEGVEDEGTFKTSCVRNIYNPTTGKYILLLSNMSMTGGEHLYLYAYENGIDAAPTKLLSGYTLPTWAERRFGDFFTVVGDWSNGYIWFRTNTTGASTTARFKISNGALTSQTPDGFNYGYEASQGKGSFYQYDMAAKFGLLVTDKIGMFYDLNSAEGQEWAAPATTDNMRRMFGITPFEFNGEKYIAYTKMKDDNAARSWFRVIKDKGSSDQFKASLEENVIVYEAAIQIDELGQSTNVMTGATYSDQTSASCAVAVLDDCVIMIGHHHNVGLSVFKMYMK